MLFIIISWKESIKGGVVFVYQSEWSSFNSNIIFDNDICLCSPRCPLPCPLLGLPLDPLPFWSFALRLRPAPSAPDFPCLSLLPPDDDVWVRGERRDFVVPSVPDFPLECPRGERRTDDAAAAPPERVTYSRVTPPVTDDGTKASSSEFLFFLLLLLCVDTAFPPFFLLGSNNPSLYNRSLFRSILASRFFS